MSATISRIQFLGGDFRGRSTPLRPPWAVAEKVFTEVCSGCGDCIKGCPEHLLIQGRGGLPRVDFQRGECTFCQACLERCPTGALQAQADRPPWSLKATIGEGCIARSGVVCSVCGEHCESRALRLLPVAGGRVVPRIETNLCTGCGACVRVCPTQAVAVHPLSPKEIAQ